MEQLLDTALLLSTTAELTFTSAGIFIVVTGEATVVGFSLPPMLLGRLNGTSD